MPRGIPNPGTMDWRNSESKQIVLDDLEAGVISLDETDTAHDLYYGMYQYTPEFIAEKVLFPQFELRLKDHREQLRPKFEAPSFEAAALAHDRYLCPKKTHNQRGEKIFYWSDAMNLLKQDVANKKHEMMSPSELRLSRPVYQEFSLRVFDQRIRQAIRKERLINWKNDTRQETQEERHKRRRELGLTEETPQELRERMFQQQG